MRRKTGHSDEQPTLSEKPKCGLCGKTKNLTKTECCDQWICDDEDSYQLFSFARNSCHRNHRRYTLCGFHFAEGHEGKWQDCQECKEQFEVEIYADFGTSAYNFEKLKNPPTFKPKICVSCGKKISLSKGGYSMLANGYSCESCTRKLMNGLGSKCHGKEQ